MDPTHRSWHSLTADEALARLQSRLTGLTHIEVAERRLKYGANVLRTIQRISPWEILLEQFKNVLILILLAATGLSLFLGHGIESIVIASDRVICGAAGIYPGIPRRTRD